MKREEPVGELFMYSVAQWWQQPLLSVLWSASVAMLLSGALCGLGGWCRAKDRLDGIGMGVVVFTFVFGLLGLAGISLKWTTALLCLVGWAGLRRWWRLPLDVRLEASVARLFLPSLRLRLKHFVVFLTGFLIFARFLSALYPQLQGDPLSYHVAAAKVWANDDHLRYISWLPWALQGGLWEYVYTAVGVVAVDPFTHLMACQTMHVLMGSLLSALVIWGICKRLSLQDDIAALVVFAAILLPIDNYMLIRAKNDGVVLVLCLLSLRSWLDRRWIPMAIFAGGAVGCKWSALFFVIPLGLLSIVWNIRDFGWRESTRLSLAWLIAIVVVLPVAGRNTWWTGNPLFPALGEIFPSDFLTPALLAEIAKYSRGGSFFAGVLQKFSWYLWAVPPVALAVFLPFFAIDRPVRRLGILVVAVILLFAAVTGTAGFVRFALIASVILAILAGVVWQGLVHRGRSWVAVAVLLLSLVNTGFDVPTSNVIKRVFVFWFYPGTTWQWISAASPLIRVQKAFNDFNAAHAMPEPIVLACYENENLFLNGGQTIPTNHPGASRLMDTHDARELALGMKREGFSHLLVRRDQPSACWQRQVNDPGFTRVFDVVIRDPAFELYRVAL